MAEKIYLIDGSGYIFRAFYAVAPLSNSAGFPTNALFGFSRMMLKLFNQSDSDHVVAVFDAGRETFRMKLYPEYKANREKCPEELVAQMPFFRDISSALGVQVLEQVGFEADDIIGTLTKRLVEAGHEVVIVSGDKDLMQLVSDKVQIWDTLKDKFIGIAGVKEKFGVGPEKVVDILGLMGDSSDNVPGLEGVGPKTATQLVEKYGSIDGIMANAAAIAEDSSIRNRKKIAEQIQSDSKILLLSRQLVQLEFNTPVHVLVDSKPVSITELNDGSLVDALVRKIPDVEKLNELSTRFEFNSLFDSVIGSIKSPAPQEDSSIEYKAVYAEGFDSFFQELSAQTEVAVDLETTSLDIREAQIVGASFCWNETEAFYLPLAHIEAASPKAQVGVDTFLKTCKPFFGNSKIKKIGQNIKYDIGVLKQHGVETEGVFFDTMLAAYVLNPDRGSYNLTTLAKEFLNKGIIEFDEVLNGAAQFSEVPVDKATRYACQDAHYAWLLFQILNKKIDEQNVTSIFHEIEMPLVRVLSRMEMTGVKLDIDFLSAMSKDFELQLESLRIKLIELAGCEFNINSPKQLSDVLFNKLGLPTKGLKKTKTGISTDSSVLEKLSSVHPLPELLLRYRLVHKLKSTYVDALPAQVSARTKRLHSSFNQTGTATGRLSSSDPNLQNIPVQTEEGRRIRNAFIAEPGSVLLAADYSQIELRLLAHMSGDPGLVSAFQAGLDIHAQTAREIMGLQTLEEVTSDIRRVGKTINFGMIYGMGPFRLSRELGIPHAVASSYIENYFARYSGVKEFFARLEEEAKSKGFVTTLFGRKRIIENIDSSGRDEGFILRAALNAPIQGTAADVIKIAMLAIDRRLNEQNDLGLRLIMQIHDELVFECRQEAVKEASILIKAEMENVAKLKVPLRVDIGSGANWGECKA